MIQLQKMGLKERIVYNVLSLERTKKALSGIGIGWLPLGSERKPFRIFGMMWISMTQ